MIVGLLVIQVLLANGFGHILALIAAAIAALCVGLFYNLIASLTNNVKPLTINPAIDLLLSIF